MRETGKMQSTYITIADILVLPNTTGSEKH